MAHYSADNVYTRSFTPREYQVELLAAAKNHNVIICLGNGPNKVFIVLKLIQELANEIRRPNRNGGKRMLFITTAVVQHALSIRHLTDLSVGEYALIDDRLDLVTHQVLVMASEVALAHLLNGELSMSDFSLLILDDCHLAIREHPMRQIMEVFSSSCERPKVLGLTSPLLPGPGGAEPGRLEAEIRRLESVLHATAETASDIVSILRYCAKPKEIILECEDYKGSELGSILENHILCTKEFLEDHRYDPSEIYDEEFMEDLLNIPDPKEDPFNILGDFLYILTTMGPWCADKAALVLLIQVEKLKVKTPYERHFLLLCMVSSVMLKIRAICDYTFQDLGEKEKIYKYSSPKILRLIEAIKHFKPKLQTPVLCGTQTVEIFEQESDSKCLSNGVGNSSCNIEHCKTIEQSKQNVNAPHAQGGDSENLNLLDSNSVINCVEEISTNVENNLSVITEPAQFHCNGKTDNICSETVMCVNTAKDILSVSESSESGYNSSATDSSRSVKAGDKSSASHLEDAEMPGRGGKWRGRGRGWRFQKKNFITPRYSRSGFQDDIEQLCAIMFVDNPFTAKILFHLFNELRRSDDELSFLSPQYTVGKVANPITETREAEIEHRKQEEVLKRFRMRECNLLISTSILEEGIDLPKCNLVIRYNVPKYFRSYAQSKGRARAPESFFLLMVEQHQTYPFISDIAKFTEIERMLLARCTNHEPSEEEETEADKYNHNVAPFCPSSVSVTMSTAIALVNRYCAKLPSDTFTRLVPLCFSHSVHYLGQLMFYCSIRLPINSPVKHTIFGHPMPSTVLARRITALETCRVLYECRELDDSLQPVGKESVLGLDLVEENEQEDGIADSLEPRPGTTKRRQYYYKRIARSLSNCRPLLGQPAHLYHLKMVLSCPLPEEQNTRGRKLHPPEDAPQGFGILTLKDIPKICPFPIFTRSGEVCVSLELQPCVILLSAEQLEMITAFLKYVFSSVLRLQKYLMLFDPEASENSFFIVPTKKGDQNVEMDWEFLKLIYSRRMEMPQIIPDKDRQSFTFDASKYHDTVVMPWYRNQDQPQYFYVAEICSHLNPKSSFPGCDYQTFEEYYLKKYGIYVQNSVQPLLDVDHTSARLNFLTPRYVNRKGVALPTSSEETKRAKRENLEQKQILIPELCMIHPFPASLWRQAVCLPCVLYRINALLLADEIRTIVAQEIGLGQLHLNPDFEWMPLDFGWSLADVLKKSKEESDVADAQPKMKSSSKSLPIKEDQIINNCDLQEEEFNNDNQGDDDEESWMEIGTWSNEMAELGEEYDPNSKIPANLSMVRYGSPTTWDSNGVDESSELCVYDSDIESELSSDVDYSSEDSSDSQEAGGPRRGLRITFKGDYLAEAEDDEFMEDSSNSGHDQADWEWQDDDALDLEAEVKCEMNKFEESTLKHEQLIKSSGMLVLSNTPLIINRQYRKYQTDISTDRKELGFSLPGYAMPQEMQKTLVEDSSLFMSCSKDSLLASGSEASFNTLEYWKEHQGTFSFDAQPDLEHHPGPNPSLLLQGLTMSNANDGINLERLETIGDSFLKYAITTYLYCAFESVHEGKLSHLRSKQVSNLNLYKLGKRKLLGESMIATKFEPHDNWLPPCYMVPRELESALMEAGLPACLWSQTDVTSLRGLSHDEIVNTVKEQVADISDEMELPCFVPYNLITQHSIPDKSIADCVEALIGAYLIACGPRGALLYMSWLGIKVLPYNDQHTDVKLRYGRLEPPKSPLLRLVPDPDRELNYMLDGYNVFEQQLKYYFHDRSYLLQAMTHASYSPNRLTDCYQRLEFLGDAVLDYLITRHLYEDKRQHSPGALTDLRSALVNNTIFASLAVRHGFHKYFRHLSPALAEVVERFVRIQEENCHAVSEEYYLIGEEECEEAEDVEVPKALGDVFESVAGAIFLDSGMSLDAVWGVYYHMMKSEIEQFSTNVPKSPIRELLELEPETAKFGKPEKLADGRRVRVTVEVFGKGAFKGIGRNYRIAKCTAAKCALKQLKKRGLLSKKANNI